MYFLVRYKWLENQATEKMTLGFFGNENAAKEVARYSFLGDNGDTIAVVYAEEGMADYSYPLEVLEWNAYYNVFIPVLENDPRYHIALTY